MSELLRFSEHTLQVASLGFMALVYITRIIWFLGFKAGGERQAPTGLITPSGAPVTTRTRGVLYSWANIAMPWAMESTRRKPLFYAQFVIFHLGVAFAIALSFVIPYAPTLLDSLVLVRFLQVMIGAACVVGVVRMVRRIADPYMRAISSPDDYFSLALLTVWFFFGVLAVSNDTSGGEWHLLGFFVLTAFFLIYVPFSKISHYLYYPFTRYYFGKTMGFRGVYPIQRQ